MNATTTNTQTNDTTVADILAQTPDIGAELAQQAPVAETTTTLTSKVGVAVDAVKTAGSAGLNFLQEHKTAVVAVAGVTAVAGAGYATYKWLAKRRDEKRAKAKEAAKAAAEAFKETVEEAIRAAAEAAAVAEEATKTAEEAARAASFAAA